MFALFINRRSAGFHALGFVDGRLLRTDSGFFDDKLLSFLEQGMLPYIVVAKLTPWVKHADRALAVKLPGE
jgi:hypothetical protein